MTRTKSIHWWPASGVLVYFASMFIRRVVAHGGVFHQFRIWSPFSSVLVGFYSVVGSALFCLNHSSAMK